MENFTEIKDKYSEDELVRIVNPKQVYFYLQNNLHPLWLETGYNNRIVYVYLKKPSLILFHAWCEKCRAYVGVDND